MSTKTQMYSELAEKASKELTHSVNEWCMFLKSHANANTTLKVYSHMFKARDRAAAQALGNIAFAISEG